MERGKIQKRTKDAKIIKTRKTGFSKFSYQPSRGKIFKFTPQKKKVDVRKHIFKQYGRSNLSMMNRKYSRRVGGINSFYTKGKKRIGGKYQDRPFASGHRGFVRITKVKNFRNRGTTKYRTTKRRNHFFKKTQNLHDKIGKLTSKELDDELDNYMGSSNVKSRLDNDLESYFKNNEMLQGDGNKGLNKVAE
ncbi:Uncharacterized protein PCOAH_00029650 [Plasmodium coatneyi]|uniref:Chromatin target of PRMT1 protein C-terminal domain-containing protein n=1 Tax=Plasmodium coatneyi TaxID=208452 RepID=A0A1B1E156_9APIC|nr:Uncharacterized protein PCOAH_00029650 [Plasmodium coatneyi]ANQ08587.1 Uncharacterized protein PCOAH_00029650 [Plasmodium coatneyi]